MENQNIRKAALDWFGKKYECASGEIFTSKFYTPQESWSNSRVWFFQIPLEIAYSQPIKSIHLLCENHLSGDAFVYLKITSLFLLKNLNSFDVSPKEKVVRIYLSAEAVDMFTEVRGKGKVDFKKFRIN
jgi:hypothetical protein